MKIEQAGCSLRSMTEEDLPLVLGWRNQERIRRYMYTDHIIPLEEHKRWFERVTATGSAMPFMFEIEGSPSGVMQFTNIDRVHGRCLWGFYLGSDSLPKGSGTALGELGLRMAFDRLNIRKLCGEALGSNAPSIRFHERLGFALEGTLRKHVLKSGVYEDVLCYAKFREE